MHAGLHIPACILNQTFSLLEIPRDSCRSKSALMPLPFIIYSSVQMPRMFASVGTGTQPDMTLFFSIFLSNLIYIVTLIWVIVLLAGPSEPAPNRYGPTI